MTKSFSKRLRKAAERSAERCDFTHAHLLKGFEALKINDDQRVTLLACLGKGGRCAWLPASDLAASMQAGEILGNLIPAFVEAHPQKHFFFATFVDDIGDTLDRSPIIRLRQLQDKVERAVRSHGLSALVVNGLHPFMNYPEGDGGRQLSIDAHALLWTDKPFNHKQVQSALNTDGTWTSALTDKPVVIKRLDTDRLADLCHYLCKPCHEAKNRKQDKETGKYRLLATRKGYRPQLAVRVYEALSQLPLLDLVRGINGGRALRQQFRAAMMKWHRARPEPERVPNNYDLWLFWLDLRIASGKDKYRPFRFDIGGPPFPSRVSGRPRRRRSGPPKHLIRGPRKPGMPPPRMSRPNA